MQLIDYVIVAGYLACLVVCGAMLARRANQGTDAYFLGDRKIPWWALGASGMSSNLDAAGTMTIISLIYTFGLHGFFIEMRGGVVLPIAVFLAFMGKWHQRSGVMTTAEWMRLRFGGGAGGRAARMLAAFTYLVITVGMVVFFIAASGKFLAVFLPFTTNQCAIGMALLALGYTMISGIHGVIWTDVFQAALIGLAAIYVGVMGWSVVSPELLAQWPGAAFNTIIPTWRNEALGLYEWFGLFLMAWVAKGVLEGLGGSGGSAYMAQRYYAAADEVTCRKLSMLWTVLFAFRWPMVLGFVLLAIHLGIGQSDPEEILPAVIASEFFPAGLRGLVVAAIFAASMSTFDSTINAGASYVVKDLFQPLFPKATDRAAMVVSYAASIGIVVLGLILALRADASILEVWVLIVIQLFPAFLVPFALRWYWGRMNGWGFSAGIIFGFSASFGLVVTGADGTLNEVQILGCITVISAIGCVLGTLLTAPVDGEVMRAFYDRVRPFGWWPRDWTINHQAEHCRDGGRLGVALVWQTVTFLIPMLLVLRDYGLALGLAVLWTGLGLLLIRTIHEE